MESCLEGTSVKSRHALQMLRHEIGHTKDTARKHYNKSPISVSFAWPVNPDKPEAWEAAIQGENEEKTKARNDIEYVINLRERIKVTSKMLSDGHLICGDFGLITDCECGLDAHRYRLRNQKSWIGNRLQDPPNALDASVESLRVLLDETHEAWVKLLRPVPQLHA
jgi:hypothetical protein